MTIGVVIGRFQGVRLHEGHIQVINTAYKETNQLVILVGVASKLGTKSNPLDFPTRAQMIRAQLSNAKDTIILPLFDHPDDKAWSAIVDATLRGMFPHDKCFLYHGRDSFAPRYSGKLPLVEVTVSTEIRSNTSCRADLAKAPIASEDFRAGVIYASQKHWPRINPTVDILAYSDTHVLMGEKSTQPGLLRFPGGYVDAHESLEDAARRELTEETGIYTDGRDTDSVMEYIMSCPIDDWRDTPDSRTLTTLFGFETDLSDIKAADDLSKLTLLTYRDFASLNPDNVVKEHRKMLYAADRFIGRKFCRAGYL